MSDETPTPATEPVHWTVRKAIPEARDRLQSRALVWVGVPMLCYLNVSLLLRITPFSGRLIPALGGYDDFLTGFVIDDSHVWGRPVGVTVAHDGALLVTDDANDTLWRIAYAGR